MLFTESFEYLLETGFQNWMNQALSNMKMSDVKTDYRPSDSDEPIIWHPETRLLTIHEPDPFQAAILFLGWVSSELPRQWIKVWHSLQVIEKNHGKEAAETVLQEYISNLESTQ